MSWFDNFLDQTCLYWEPPKKDGLGGYSWIEPIEINSRWENRQVESKDEAGNNILANTTVWCSNDLMIGGYLLLAEWKEIVIDRVPPIKENYFGKSVIMAGELYQRKWAQKIVNAIYMKAFSGFTYRQYLLQ